MKITYNGHACFTIESNGYRLVLDPYDEMRGYPAVSLEAEAVNCSHQHSDHNYTHGVKIVPAKTENPFKLTKIPSYHDNQQGALRGSNDISVIEAEGKKIAHLGDLGHMLSEEQADKLKNLDAILVPVGGHYTIDAKQAAEIVRMLQPKTIIPMHYKDGEKSLEVFAELDPFIELLSEDEKKKLALVKAYGKSIEL